MKKSDTLRFVEAGILIAAAMILSVIQPFQLPFGGGITIASMLPIIIISYRHGIKWGCFSAFVYSLLQIATGFGTVRSFFMPESEGGYEIWKAVCIVLMDYILAYTVLGMGGIFRNKLSSAASLCLGSIIALMLRFVVHIISGAIFFGSWAEWFFTQEGFYKIGSTIMENFSGTGLAVVYSVFYNGLYMLPEIIITAIAAYAVGKVPAIAKKVK